ncbi:MAG: DUF1592 domain-containing protein [Fimbriimonadaceae bacterium]
MAARFDLRPVWVLAASGALLGYASSRPPVDATRSEQSTPPAYASGARIYAQKCASCHGPKGEGGPGYSGPLVGTLSLGQLTAFVKDEMPPEGAKLSAKDAEEVSKYIFESFYSPVAQERNRPAEISLARLTVRQYRNALADILRPWHGAVPEIPQRGLRGEYYKGRYFDEKTKGGERIDPQVAFDFGTAAPMEGEFEPHVFSIVWNGSLLAPETGEYEIILRSNHATKLYLNGWQKPLIDGSVQSGDQVEHRGTIKLLGGRAYPVRLEFNKSSTGVDDAEKRKQLPPTPAYMEFRWKRPKLAEEVIPSRFLYPEFVAPTFVSTTPFPPDDRSTGFERGVDISKQWADATTLGAIEAAEYAAENFSELTGVKDDAPDRAEKVKEFAEGIVTRAFRRPLTPELRETFVEKQFANAEHPDIALKRTIILALKSPRFLYRELVSDQENPYAVAAELSFGLWDTIPDHDLMSAAAHGRLSKPEDIAAQAQRMVARPRARAKLREFLVSWLKLDDTPDLVKSTEKFPGFTEELSTDLRNSFEIFLEQVMDSETADYRELLTSPQIYMNHRMAEFYGASVRPEEGFRAVEYEPGRRAGVVTHPYVLSRWAYLETSSPIHRGVFVARSLLGRVLQPPPEAFTPLAPSLHPNMTTRERVTMQTKPPACASCHTLINPLGFPLEQFDAVGKYQSRENGKPVDSSGSYKAKTGDVVTFKGGVDLARYLAQSDEAQLAFVEKMFHHFVKQPILAHRPGTGMRLKSEFADDAYNIRRLMGRVVAEAAIHTATARGDTR